VRKLWRSLIEAKDDNNDLFLGEAADLMFTPHTFRKKGKKAMNWMSDDVLIARHKK